MSPSTNPSQGKFSPVPCSEDSSFIELEDKLTPTTRFVFHGLGWKVVVLSSIISPAVLFFLLFNIYWSLYQDHESATRAIFGEIPWIPHVFGGDDDFINSDPYDGKAWSLFRGKPFDLEHQSTVWDNIYPSDHITIENPQKFGFDGGIDMSAEARNSTDFAAGSQGFTLAVLHQIHCIGILKHAILNYNNSGLTEFEIYHSSHCVEVLRELVLCKGDLTVQRPKGLKLSMQWPSQHICRDEIALMNAIWKRAIVKTDNGWIRR